MDVVQKIPYILSLVSSLIVAIVSLQQLVEFQEICLRVSITLIEFYFIGMLVKKVLINIIQETKEKEELEKEQNIEQEQKEKIMEQNQNNENKNDKQDNNENEEIINEFSPLQPKEVIKDETKVISNMLKEK